MRSGAHLKAFARTLLRGTATGERMASLAASQRSYSQFGEDVHLAAYYARLLNQRNIEVEEGFYCRGRLSSNGLVE